MRQGELAGLLWEDVNFETRLIAVQRSYEGPTKSGSVRYVPILDVLFPLLQEWRSKAISTFVFPNDFGGMLKPNTRIFREMLGKVLKKSGFPEREGSNGKKGYLVFHDLRHSYASQWVMHGGDVFKLQNILGHQSIQMTMRYAHLSPHVFQEDYGRFNKKEVERLIPAG
jgi:integrase